MKKIILSIVFLMSCMILHAQQYNPDVHNIVEIPNLSKKQLYKKAVSWIAVNFNSANTVIQLEDEDEGKIVVKGAVGYSAPAFNPGTNYSGSFYFTMVIECKDNKYKYDITNVYHQSDMPHDSIGAINEGSKKKKIREAAVLEIKLLADQFEHGMLTPSNSNW